jgi:cytochrome P450
MIDAIVDGNRHIYLRFAWPWLFNFQPTSWFAPARWLFPEMERERNSFTQVADDFTTERLKSIEEGKCNRQDIMSALLAARDPRTGEKLSIEETCSEAHLMIAAGMYDFSRVYEPF